jgi:hypothetical protein
MHLFDEIEKKSALVLERIPSRKRKERQELSFAVKKKKKKETDRVFSVLL